ncbi:MAG: YkgJ family cysteine cluster protein [Lachnospiraceae bacterium]|nr:YkgJ family cysteine cluster protein [Lachnospiraceae bacterium]
MDINEIMEKLKGSMLGEHMEFMHELYEELNTRQVRFCDDFNLHCKEDCCSCCEHFVPDLTDLEAQYMALGLISEGRDQEILELLNNRDDDMPPCPLCDSEKHIYHCKVYEWRPLICRLFGSAVTKDKTGADTFRNCKWNEHVREITNAELEAKKDEVVVMSDYGMRLEEEDPDNTSTRLIRSALAPAVEKLKLILSYEEMQ